MAESKPNIVKHRRGLTVLRPWPGLLFCGGHFAVLPIFFLLVAIYASDRTLPQVDREVLRFLIMAIALLPTLIELTNRIVTWMCGLTVQHTDHNRMPRRSVHRYSHDSLTDGSRFLIALMLPLVFGPFEIRSLFAFLIMLTLLLPGYSVYGWLRRDDRIILDDTSISRHAGSKELWRVRRDTRADYDPEAETVTLRGHTIHLRGLFRPDLLLKSLPRLRQPD